jgi:hypothetical protein
MQSTYTPNLGLELQATGENRTTWGIKANNDFSLIEQAITGYISIPMGDTNITLTKNNAAADQSRMAILNFTGANTAIRTVTIPAVSKLYTVINATSGGFAINIQTGAGVAVSVPSASRRTLYCDGTNVFFADDVLPLAGGTMTGPINMNGQGVNGASTFNGAVLQNFRNKIINGAAAIAQRGTGSYNIAAGQAVYTADRWRIFNNTNQTLNVQAPTPIDYTPASSGNYPRLRLAFTTAPTTGDVFVTQRIEGANTLSGQAATMSFAQAFSETITGTCYLAQNFGSGGSASVGTSTQTFSGTTGGNFGIVKLLFNIPSTVGKVFGAGNFLEYVVQMPIRTTNPVSLTDFSLVAGDATAEANPFSPRPNALELPMCQRYYQTYTNLMISGNTTGGNPVFADYIYIVSMRTTPSVTVTNAASSNANTLAINSASSQRLRMQVTITGTGYGTATADYTMEAEL